MTCACGGGRGRRHLLVRRAVLPAFIWVAFLAPSPALGGTWQTDLSISYQAGKYGSDEKTTLFFLPLTLRHIRPRGELAVTVPYVDMKTAGSVVIVDGVPQAGGGASGGSISGLGDIVLKGKYAAVEQKGPLPYVDVVCRLKLPTAPDDLGTGEADFGIGTDLSYRFGGKYFAMADLMYTIIGDPPGLNYRNRIAWNLGVGWQPRPDLTLSLSYDSASSLVSRPAATALMLYAGYRLRPKVRLFALLDLGLSDTASDVGLTAGVKHTF